MFNQTVSLKEDVATKAVKKTAPTAAAPSVAAGKGGLA